MLPSHLASCEPQEFYLWNATINQSYNYKHITAVVYGHSLMTCSPRLVTGKIPVHLSHCSIVLVVIVYSQVQPTIYSQSLKYSSGGDSILLGIAYHLSHCSIVLVLIVYSQAQPTFLFTQMGIWFQQYLLGDNLKFKKSMKQCGCPCVCLKSFTQSCFWQAKHKNEYEMQHAVHIKQACII